MLLYHKIHHVQEGMRRHFVNFLLIVLVGQHRVCVCVCVCARVWWDSFSSTNKFLDG